MIPTLRLMSVTDINLLFQLVQKNQGHISDLKDLEYADYKTFVAHYSYIFRLNLVSIYLIYTTELVGAIEIAEETDHFQIGYWIDYQNRNKGIASNALDILLKSHYNKPVHARVAKTNLASIRVLEKLTFELVTTDSTYYYYIYYG